MVHHREGQIGPADLTPRHFEAGKGLWRGGLMNQVAVNIDDGGLARLFGDEVSLPNLFV